MGLITGGWFGGGSGGTTKPKPKATTYSGYSPLQTSASQIPTWNQAYGVYSGLAEPQYAALDQQQAANRSKIAALQAQYQQAQKFSGQNMGFANQGYNLNMQGLGIQQQGAGRDFDSMVKLQNLLNDNYVREMAEVDKFQQLYGQGYQGQLGYTNKLEDLANQLLGLQTFGREQDYFFDKRKSTGQLAASGGFGGTGTEATLGHLFTQKDTDIRGYQLSNKEKMAGIDEQRRALKQAYEEAMLGFEGQRGDLTYSYNTQAESLWNQAEAKQDEIEMLDLKAQEYGLQRDQLIASLTQGLQNMQLQNTINVNDIMAALASGDVNRMILAQQVMQQAQQVAGPPPPPKYTSQATASGQQVKKGKVF